jgi:integrase
VWIPLRRQHRQRQEAERDEWGDDYEGQDLVFCLENGAPIHPHSLSQTFERLVEKSGLPRIRLHDLRHTHATIAGRAGVPVKVISERLGHESPAFTLKQYAHVIPGMQRDAAAQIAMTVLGESARTR